jgi:hypothetical protein
MRMSRLSHQVLHSVLGPMLLNEKEEMARLRATVELALSSR